MNKKQSYNLIKAIAKGNVPLMKNKGDLSMPLNSIKGFHVVEMINGERTITKTVSLENFKPRA